MTLNINNNFRSIVDHEASKFDPETRAVSTLNSLHRLAHEGFVSHVSGKIIGLVDTGVQDFLLAVPDVEDIDPNMNRISFTLGRGDVDIVFYEGTTTSADGAVLPQFNVNRASTNTSQTVITSGPTVTGVGTVIHTAWVPPTATGTGQSGGGIVGGDSSGEEWLLAPNTKYLVRLTNNSGVAIDLRYEFLWYEIQWQNAGK